MRRPRQNPLDKDELDSKSGGSSKGRSGGSSKGKSSGSDKNNAPLRKGRGESRGGKRR